MSYARSPTANTVPGMPSSSVAVAWSLLFAQVATLPAPTSTCPLVMVAKLGAWGWEGGASGARDELSSRQVARSRTLATPIRAPRATVRRARMGKASGRLGSSLAFARVVRPVFNWVTDYLGRCCGKNAGVLCCNDPTSNRNCGPRGDARTRQYCSGGSLHPLDRLALQAGPSGARLHPGSLGEVAESAVMVLFEPGDGFGRRFERRHAVLFGESATLLQRPLAHVRDQALADRQIDVHVHTTGADGSSPPPPGMSQ